MPSRFTRWYPNSLAGYKILVVDGSDNARIITRSYLLAAGFKATAAASAGEALEILRHASSPGRAFSGCDCRSR
ncbi:MAG: hypothetical protein R3C24_01990 [Cyanobacteriota/Melainabacteria group bacterium]